MILLSNLLERFRSLSTIEKKKWLIVLLWKGCLYLQFVFWYLEWCKSWAHAHLRISKHGSLCYHYHHYCHYYHYYFCYHHYDYTESNDRAINPLQAEGERLGEVVITREWLNGKMREWMDGWIVDGSKEHPGLNTITVISPSARCCHDCIATQYHRLFPVFLYPSPPPARTLLLLHAHHVEERQQHQQQQQLQQTLLSLTVESSQCCPACVLVGMRHPCHCGVWAGGGGGGGGGDWRKGSGAADNLSPTCRWGRRYDSRVADVYPGVDFIEVLRGEAVKAAAVGEKLVELLDGNLAAAAAAAWSRHVCCRRRRLLMLLFGRTQVFLHGFAVLPASSAR